MLRKLRQILRALWCALIPPAHCLTCGTREDLLPDGNTCRRCYYRQA